MATSGPVVTTKDGHRPRLPGRVGVVLDAATHQRQIPPEPVEPESDTPVHVLLALRFRGQLLQPRKFVRDARQCLALRIFGSTCIASEDEASARQRNGQKMLPNGSSTNEG
jgi:hypothetical protein